MPDTDLEIRGAGSGGGGGGKGRSSRPLDKGGGNLQKKCFFFFFQSGLKIRQGDPMLQLQANKFHGFFKDKLNYSF